MREESCLGQEGFTRYMPEVLLVYEWINTNAYMTGRQLTSIQGTVEAACCRKQPSAHSAHSRTVVH